MPSSPAQHWTRKVLPVPIRPAMRYPIGSARSAPRCSSCVSSRSHAFTASCPATLSSVNGDSTKSSSPWHSRSISSFLISPSHAAVIRRSLPSASAIAVRAPTRLRPVKRAAIVSTGTSLLAARSGNCVVTSVVRYDSMSASFGSGRCSAAACGFSTTSPLRSCRPSLSSTVTMFDWTIAGSFAQPRTLTVLAANGPPSCSASPRGTTNSANSMMTAIRFGFAVAPGSAWRLSVRRRYRSISSSAEPGSRISVCVASLPSAFCTQSPQSSAPRVARTPRLRS